MKLIIVPALLALAAPLAARHLPAPADALPRAAATPADTAALRAAVREAERQTGGVIGFHVRHLESGETFGARGGEPFFLASVLKVPLAVHVLRQVERGRIGLDDTVRIDAARLVWGENAFRRRLSAGTRVTVAQLLEGAISDSDNTAANELLHLVGGPAAVTADLREMGFAQIRIDRDYTRLSEYGPLDARDTGTPEAVTNLLAALWSGRLLGPAQTQRLIGWMTDTRNPEGRMVAGVPRGTTVAHKTGTWTADSEPHTLALNDVGVITLPGGRGHLAVAVFVRNARGQIAQTQGAIALVTRAAYAQWANGAR
ncbi:class A beta-lactamase [Longimicrobium sp.]|uniref:class A beta-lactamase n=1 Tax=Longimicrobium sp. TaxID=2029185 RepID=UPI002E2EF22E|nr:class A beta-lactamase [Longimicrobium sp.]HEX6036487.1 class A beta-lactamase [Longimicrobium sp.]